VVFGVCNGIRVAGEKGDVKEGDVKDGVSGEGGK
jgi:hypothetical protein